MNIHVILKYLINFSTSTFFKPLVHNKWHITKVIFIETISIEGLLAFWDPSYLTALTEMQTETKVLNAYYEKKTQSWFE